MRPKGLGCRSGPRARCAALSNLLRFRAQYAAAPEVQRPDSYQALLEVEMHELQRVFERQVRELAGGVLGKPERSALDRPAEADVSVRLRGHYESRLAQFTLGARRAIRLLSEA